MRFFFSLFSLLHFSCLQFNCRMLYLNIPRFYMPIIKSLSADRRNYAKAHGLVLSGENRNNAYHQLEDLKQIDRSLLAAHKLACSKRIGKFRIK